jgi:hypothetical protein
MKKWMKIEKTRKMKKRLLGNGQLATLATGAI